ncbi:putative nonribosomal peptide synthetase [Mycena sp. CBHHK59/15]|nr:putative nonribosomal peptide synthetase [Mycena sp. CBHHK59/15]
MSGIYGTLLQPLYGIPLAVYPPTATSPEALPIFPSPDNILEHARKTNCRAMTILPALLAAWSKSPDAIEYLKTMHMVALGGGTLPEKLGNTLVNAGVKLRALYGATEFGAISTIVPLEGDEMDWEWVRFVDQAKLRWIPQGDGTFECQILTWENHHMSVENLQDVRGYATSDLWVNHPEKKHLWKIVGRIDDVIVHISGEKTVPAPIENIVMSSPYVIGTVMFGREREQAGILIETISSLQIDVQNANKVAELRNKLWPLIEEANKIAPAFSRIFKEMILFTSANKPLPRAGKGTVMRKAAVDVYAPEIDALYNVVGEKSNADDSIKPPALWNVPNIRGWLIQLAADLTNASDILPDVDLFHQGFDSLSATFLRLRILGAIRSSKETRVQKLGGNITQNLVYSYPTIFQLSDFLDGLITSGTSGDTGVDAKELIEAMVIKHTLGLVRPIASPSNTGNPAVVLLTGSTGSLGSQILASLLSNNRVVKVYAFNRPSSSSSALAQRHSNVFKERGLDTALLGSSKLILVEGQTDQTDLGLKSDLYNEMRDSVTLIIHNAWKLDFNMSLASFEPHIRGTRHLVDFALSSPQYPRFLFTSSIAFAMSWDSAKGPCPEEILTDASVAVGATGYGQSKFVVEQILAKSGLNAACIRIGQVCGTLPTGAWATSDWLPILVKTSIILGRLPLADGLVSWIDFDTAARGIVDVGFASSNFSPVFNLVHPRPVSWNFVMTSLRDVLNRRNGSAHLQLVPFPEWYADLEYSASQKTSSRESQNLPGVKLLEFFHHLSKVSVQSKDSEFGGITFSTDKIRALSSAVKDAAVIETESIQAWVNYWSASGFL